MKPTLLVMAAGMGSRYGGLKQIDPVGPNGEVIIEYSIYDAIKAGFGKVVFVIRKEFEQAFRDQIGDKAASKIDIEYTYQELGMCLGDFELPADRVKPWGTGHAILVAKDMIDTPFAVINADDFYGQKSFDLMAEYLKEQAGSAGKYAMVGYPLSNTLSEHGSVSRGVCTCDEAFNLQKVVEHTKIFKAQEGAVCEMEDGSKKQMTGQEYVSMNFWGFGVDLFGHLASQFADFLKTKGNELKSEFYIPTVVDSMIKTDQATVKVLRTDDKWFGVTYKEDKEYAQQSIKSLIEKGVYPENLWG